MVSRPSDLNGQHGRVDYWPSCGRQRNFYRGGRGSGHWLLVIWFLRTSGERLPLAAAVPRGLAGLGVAALAAACTRSRSARTPGAAAGQLFFNDTLADTVYRAEPCAERGNRGTRNASNAFFTQAGGPTAILAITKSGSDYTGTITVGVK